MSNENFILDIREVTNTKWNTGHVTYDGYIINTSKEIIAILIDNYQNCCESWGYVSSDDNFDEYIGQKVLDVVIVDKALETIDLDPGELDEGDVIFMNLVTTAGTLQFAVYNGHNGYYGHNAFVTRAKKEHLEEAYL